MSEPRHDAGPDAAGRDLGERTRHRIADNEVNGASDAEVRGRSAADRLLRDDELVARADKVGARLDGGEIDEPTHDAELQELVGRADPTQADPMQTVDVAGRIRDPDRREWTQASILGRYAEAEGYSSDELAGFALELGIDTGVDGFLAGLSPQQRATVGEALDARAGVRDAGSGVDGSSGAEIAGWPAADGTVGDAELVTPTDEIGRQLVGGDVDEPTHDAELEEPVARADPTQAAMDVAGRIRDPDDREWMQVGILARNAEAEGYSNEQLAGLAVDLGTDTRVDAFVAGLPPEKRAGVLDVLGERSDWPVTHTSGWTPTDRELFRNAGLISGERERGIIDDAAHDARLQELAGEADPTTAGWEIARHIRDPVAQAETQADLAGAVARAGDRTMAGEMAESIDPDVIDTGGRHIRSRALAEVAMASDTRDAGPPVRRRPGGSRHATRGP